MFKGYRVDWINISHQIIHTFLHMNVEASISIHPLFKTGQYKRPIQPHESMRKYLKCVVADHVQPMYW
jgi:hypothetical protein